MSEREQVQPPIGLACTASVRRRATTVDTASGSGRSEAGQQPACHAMPRRAGRVELRRATPPADRVPEQRRIPGRGQPRRERPAPPMRTARRPRPARPRPSPAGTARTQPRRQPTRGRRPAAGGADGARQRGEWRWPSITSGTSGTTSTLASGSDEREPLEVEQDDGQGGDLGRQGQRHRLANERRPAAEASRRTTAPNQISPAVASADS